MKARGTAVIAGVLMAGCASIEQRVSPVVGLESTQICLIQRPHVAGTFNFLAAYQRALEGRGFEVRPLPGTASFWACPVVSDYVAFWRSDLAIYLAYAELRVFRDGRLAGSALYDAAPVSVGPQKFIKAESKIRELVDQLLPR